LGGGGGVGGEKIIKKYKQKQKTKTRNVALPRNANESRAQCRKQTQDA
jgi:hypothetical protein